MGSLPSSKRDRGHLMPTALQVNIVSGYFSIPAHSEPEDWETILNQADKVEYMYKLTGWGEYTTAYKVTFGYIKYTYMVAE